MNQVPEIQSAHGILLLSGNYLLQLRDNKPTIAFPGQWALFGGMLQNGETPLQAIEREVFEELEIKPLEYKQLWFKDYYAFLEKTIIRSWFFEADVTDVWSYYKLNEGQSVKSFRFEEVARLEMSAVMRNAVKRHYDEDKSSYIIRTE